MSLITGDFTDTDWLLLIEDDGSTGLGRVRGYFVFETRAEAEAHSTNSTVREVLALEPGEDIPHDVCNEIMSYADFKSSYGNRMPLHNRRLTLW